MADSGSSYNSSIKVVNQQFARNVPQQPNYAQVTSPDQTNGVEQPALPVPSAIPPQPASN